MKSKVLTAWIVFTILFTNCVYGAAITSVTEDRLTGKVVVNGTYESDSFRPKFVLKIVSESGKMVALVQANGSSAEGRFAIAAPLDTPTGSYHITVNCNVFQTALTKNLIFYNIAETQELTALLMAKTNTEDFKKLLIEKKDNFALDMAIWNKVADQDFIYSQMFGVKDSFKNVADVQKYFLQFSVIEKINECTDSEGIKELLTIYADVLDISSVPAYNIYKDFTKDQMSILSQKLLQLNNTKMYNISDIHSKIAEAAILTAVKSVDSYGVVGKILQEYRNIVYSSAIGGYYSLSDTAEIDLELIGMDFDSLEALRAKILELLQTPASHHSESGGGGGGSSSSFTAGVAEPLIPQVEKGFTDLDSVQWAKQSIEKLYALGIVNGKGGGTFAPNDIVTREEFVKMLTLAFQLPAADIITQFTDISDDAWYAPCIYSAAAIGAVFGQEDGSFGVGQPITRQDMAVMAYRFAQKNGYTFDMAGDIAEFKDRGAISDYAKDAVSYLKGAGIINGLGDETFGVYNSCTRAQAACVIYRLAVYNQGGAMK